jgi:acid phosphatase
MKKQQRLLLIILLFLTSALVAQEKLIFAIDMVRHGDRMPLHSLPAVSDYPSKEKLGQLTAKGMEQHFHLGKKLRQYYVEEAKLLPKQFDNATIFIRSTDFDRTIMSAQALLTGLYPIGVGPMKNGYQPIPIHTHSQDSDPLIKNDTHAPKFDELLAKYVVPQKAWQAKIQETKAHWAKWTQATGWKIENLRDVMRLGNILYIYRLHKAPLPTGLSAQDIDTIIAIGEWGMPQMYRPKEMGEFLGRGHLEMIHRYLEKTTDPKNELKYVLFSAHDSSLLALMSALGAPLDMVPPYASHFSLRVYENEQQQKSIMVYFNDQVISLPYCNGTRCEFEEFKKRLIA